MFNSPYQIRAPSRNENKYRHPCGSFLKLYLVLFISAPLLHFLILGGKDKVLLEWRSGSNVFWVAMEKYSVLPFFSLALQVRGVIFCRNHSPRENVASALIITALPASKRRPHLCCSTLGCFPPICDSLPLKQATTGCERHADIKATHSGSFSEVAGKYSHPSACL